MGVVAVLPHVAVPIQIEAREQLQTVELVRVLRLSRGRHAHASQSWLCERRGVQMRKRYARSGDGAPEGGGGGLKGEMEIGRASWGEPSRTGASQGYKGMVACWQLGPPSVYEVSPALPPAPPRQRSPRRRSRPRDRECAAPAARARRRRRRSRWSRNGPVRNSGRAQSTCNKCPPAHQKSRTAAERTAAARCASLLGEKKRTRAGTWREGEKREV